MKKLLKTKKALDNADDVIHGTLRRECLDRTLFWTATDLEAKLLDFRVWRGC